MLLVTDAVKMVLQEIFKELVEGRERPAIRLEPVTELTLEDLGGADPTLEYVIDDDDYYYFDEYNMVEQDDRLAAINYQVTMMMVVSLLRYVYIEQEKRQRLPEISCQPYSESYDVCHSSER